MKSWLNSEILSADAVVIAPNDRGFLLADGLFETMKAAQGEILHLEAHLQRMRHGLSVLKLTIRYSDEALGEAMRALLAANELAHASLRLTVTRGVGPRGLLPPDDENPTVLITCAPASEGPMELPPARLAVSPFRRNEGSPLSRLKVLNYLDNILALQKAKSDGFDDAILLNNAGKVTCASAANLFLLLDGDWVTPPVSDGVLPGITRRAVLSYAETRGHRISERSVMEADLERVRAAFLTNSLINLRPVASINGRALSGGGADFLPDGHIF